MINEPKLESFYQGIATELKALRLAKEWGRPSAAKHSGVSTTTIFNIENAKHPFVLDSVFALCRAYETDPITLIGKYLPQPEGE